VTERKPDARGYNWATHFLGEHKCRDMFLQFEGWMQGCRSCSVRELVVSKSKDVKLGSKQAECSKEDFCDSKSAVLVMTTMMMWICWKRSRDNIGNNFNDIFSPSQCSLA
jgi:hypothetical protein